MSCHFNVTHMRKNCEYGFGLRNFTDSHYSTNEQVILPRKIRYIIANGGTEVFFGLCVNRSYSQSEMHGGSACCRLSYKRPDSNVFNKVK